MGDAQTEVIIRYLLTEIDVLLEDIAVLRQRIESLKNGDNSDNLFLGDELCQN